MRIFFIVLLSLCGFTSLWADGSRYAPESVLSSGKWVKIRIERTGIYKITYDELRKMGFEPEKVSVHGYGGWPLDEDFSSSSKQPYIDDLPATAIYRGNNYILFYGRGPVKWEYDDTTKMKTFVHTNNPYSNYGYYFLTDATDTKEMETEKPVEGAVLNITSYDEYRVHETERVSVNNSGRELFGEYISGGTNTITTPEFNIPGILNENAKVYIRAIARPKSNRGAMTFLLNGEELTTLGFNIPSSSYVKAYEDYELNDWKGEKTENTKVTISYNNTSDENVYLDYIRMHVQRELKQYGDYTFFRSLKSIHNVSRFIVENANANTVVFDVTDVLNPKLMETQLDGTTLSFAVKAGELREFVVVQTGQSLTGWTRETGDVPNQNLHALPQTEMIIIASDAFKKQAEELAEKHRNNGLDKLTVEIVNPQHIYNEFSSGTPDATAYRRFMKMLYDRSKSDGTTAPKYLLLFGDGAVDNRRLTSDWKNTSYPNMLLTYQSPNSLDSYSYVTDDYFGALGDTPFTSSTQLQIGIGRFPVRTVSEANVVVKKVLNYIDNKTTGSWKNRLCFVADDGSVLDQPPYSTEYMKQSDDLAESLRASYPDFLTTKIFFDAYKKETVGGKATYPGVRSQIQKELNDDNGLLIINYIGHGNTQSLSDEDVLNISDISKFRYTKLPLWITATCDFTRFDDISTSAGEAVFLSESGGIALFTTVRVVYSRDNYNLNIQLLKHLFERDTEGRRLTLGDVMRNTKNSLSGVNKLNFILIGDPALKLSYPEYKMEVQTINGQPISNDTVIFKAQDRITATGVVRNPDKDVATDFSGSLEVTVLDSKQSIKTLDNNKRDSIFTFSDYPNRIYMGNHEVTNGTFEFSFVVQKDISYSNGAGIMNLYASDSHSENEAQGTFDKFNVGGTSEEPIEDTVGPEIRTLYLNDTTFVSGGKVNTTPLFVARLWDETGVNVSGSSIGHDITLTIEGASPSVNHVLNTYYRLIPETEGEGLVKFPVPALTPGLYTAEFRAWDLLNNSSLQTFEFEVVEGIKPVLGEVIATPVPARDNVRFMIYHNRPEANVKVSLMVFDLAGRLQWKTEEITASDLNAPLIVDWNLTSTGGARLRPGIYIYRAAISTDNSKEATKAKKLIILAQ